MPEAKIIKFERNPVTGEVLKATESKIERSTEQQQLTEALQQHRPFADLLEVEGRTVPMSLREAFLTNPDAGNILRNELRFLAFSRFAEMPRSFDLFTTFADSNKPEEDYLRDAGIGVLPKVKSGDPAPELLSGFEGGVTIQNFRYAGLASILGDWLRFDQIGKIRQAGNLLGRSARMTEEDAVYSLITTAGNFTRNSTTGDNDIGANTAATTFAPVGLDTALTTISTSKDRKSGHYLGYKADTFICGPRLEMAAKQFFMSNELIRTHGNTTIETRGMGTKNPYAGLISNMVVSPWFGASYQWALVDSTVQSLTFQTVEPFRVEQETMVPTSEAYLTRDVIRYLVQGFFGVGIVDDRAWYYSSSTTAPTGF